MPRIVRTRRSNESAPLLWRILTDQIDYEALSDRERWEYLFLTKPDTLEAHWRIQRDDVLAWWIKRHPGTRPWCWWRFDAPEDRRQIGGTGYPASEAPDHGVTWLWCGVDPKHPPIVESQAAYLKRLELLADGETGGGDMAPEALANPERWLSTIEGAGDDGSR
jgi:hypothetical protein